MHISPGLTTKQYKYVLRAPRQGGHHRFFPHLSRPEILSQSHSTLVKYFVIALIYDIWLCSALLQKLFLAKFKSWIWSLVGYHICSCFILWESCFHPWAHCWTVLRASGILNLAQKHMHIYMYIYNLYSYVLIWIH